MSLYSCPDPVVPAETIRQMRGVADALYEEGAIDSAYLLAAIVMDLVQVTGKPSFYADTPFGVCPACGDYDEVIQVADKNYGVCHEHRSYWYIGRNYLPSQDKQYNTSNMPSDTLDEHLVYPPNLLNIYTSTPTLLAFPQAICPCCGKSRMHAPWCLYPKEGRPDLNVNLVDLVV